MDFSMMSILRRHRESMPTQNISCFRAKTQKSDRKTGLIHPFNGLIQQSRMGAKINMKPESFKIDSQELAAIVPDCYAEFRPIVADGLTFFLQQLSATRLAEIFQ